MQRYIGIISIMTIAFVSTMGQTVFWTGTRTGGDGVSWEDPNNWNMGELPAGFAEVLITNDSVSITTAKPELGRIELDNAILTVHNLLVLNSSDTFAILAKNGSSVINEDIIEIEEAGDGDFGDRGIEIISNSSFQNNGLCRVSEMRGGYAIRLESNSQFHNNGPLHVTGTGTLILAFISTFTNNDSIFGSLNGPSHGSGIATSAGLITNNGYIGLSVNLGNIGLYCLSAGVWENYGNIDMSLMNCNVGIWVSGSQCEFNHYRGTIQYSNANLTGIRMRTNTFLTIHENAVMIYQGGGTGDFLEMETGAELNCNGIMQLGN